MRCLETVIKLTEILTDTFTKDELLRFLIIQLVNGKLVCPDGIAPEAFKYCDFDEIIQIKFYLKSKNQVNDLLVK